MCRLIASSRRQFIHERDRRNFCVPLRHLTLQVSFTSGCHLARMESQYRANADEAMKLAEEAYDPRDRMFWLNIAKAWLSLIEYLRRP